jgi:hypothetical protein
MRVLAQSIVYYLLFMTALAFPRAEPPTEPPVLPTIHYDIGDIKNTLTPILGKGSDGGIEAGGIGSHDAGVLHEHGSGDAQIRPKGAEVCLTQTFVIAVSVLDCVLTRADSG